ncbi:hypothetical protein [Enterococcus sp. AZ163]|uniref:hypothetical protein n=2 Tax=Enterococcus TaxID=1350 RepID=UPI003D297C93
MSQVMLINSLKYLVFQFFIIFLPGMTVCSFYQKKINDPLFFNVFSYGVGVAINIVLYFLLSIMNLLQFANLTMLLLAGFCCVILIKSSRGSFTGKQIDINTLFYVNFIVMLSLVTVLVAFTLPNLLIGQKESYSYYVDSLWHIGNIVEIKLGLPIEDLRVLKVPMHYHFGMHVHIAMMDFFIGGISVASTFYSFSQLGIVILLFCTMFALAKKCLNSNLLAAATTMLLFIIERSFLFVHIFKYPSGVGLALAFELLAIYYFIFVLLDKTSEKMYKFIINAIPLFLLLFGSLYSKAPMGVLLYCGCIITIAYKAIKTRKDYKNIIAFIVIITGLFYLLYSNLFVSSDAGSSSLGLGLDFGRSIIKDSTFYQFLLNRKIESIIIFRAVAVLFGLIQWLLNLEILRWVMPLYILGLLLYLRHPLKIKSLNFFLSSVILGGLVLNFCIRQDGASEYYFYMAIVPLILLQAVDILTSIIGNIKASALLLVLISLAPIFTSANTFTKLAIEGGINFAQNTGSITVPQIQSEGDSISRKEYQGMIWLKNHSQKNDIILTDRSFFIKEDYPDLRNTIRNRNYRYHYYSAFSERRNYLEGFAYQRDAYGDLIRKRFDIVSTIFSEEVNAELEQVKKEGVKYIVVTKSLHPKVSFNEKVVFENSDIRIYELH